MHPLLPSIQVLWTYFNKSSMTFRNYTFFGFFFGYMHIRIVGWLNYPSYQKKKKKLRSRPVFQEAKCYSRSRQNSSQTASAKARGNTRRDISMFFSMREARSMLSEWKLTPHLAPSLTISPEVRELMNGKSWSNKEAEPWLSWSGDGRFA